MAANLRTTHYANGEPVDGFAPTTDTSEYGLLYDWYATMHGENSCSDNPSGVQGICPNGWHVPSDAEWFQRTTYLSNHSEYVCGGNSENIGKSLAAQYGWQMTNNQYAVGVIWAVTTPQVLARYQPATTPTATTVSVVTYTSGVQPITAENSRTTAT